MVRWNTPYKHSLVCQEYLYMAVSCFLNFSFLTHLRQLTDTSLYQILTPCPSDIPLYQKGEFRSCVFAGFFK